MSYAVGLAVQALLADSAVIAITSTRIKPLPLADGTDYPAIAVAMSAEEEEYLLAGSSQYPQSTVQIHCVAETATDALVLGEAVKVALRDLSFTLAGPPSTHASFAKEAVDFTDYSDDLSTHRRVMSFSVRWR